MEWLAILVSFLLGGLIGVVLTKRTSPTEPIGTLRIDTSDQDGPFLFLELDKPVGEFYKKSQVTLKVNTESYISSK